MKREEDWDKLTCDDIIKIIRNAGIVGLGGVSIPAHVKLSRGKGSGIDTLIINGCESEPYLTADDMLMKTYPFEVVTGIRIILKALGISRALIGIEDNKMAAAKKLTDAITETAPPEHISIVMLKTKYPQGAEKNIIYSLTGRKVPSKGAPADIHAAIFNIGTVHAVREAVVTGKPLFERYVTVSGSLIRNPGNYKIRIGTRISSVIEECGGLTGKPARIISGGPMSGYEIHDTDMPVTKETTGIIFLSRDQVYEGPFHPCIRCGSCVNVCPAGLMPCELGNGIEKMNSGSFDYMERLGIHDCILCGACSYVCPAKRPMSQYIKLALELPAL